MRVFRQPNGNQILIGSSVSASRFRSAVTGALHDGTLVRGASYSFDAPAGLSGGSGDYVATNIPLGMTLNATTGALTGKPLSAQPVTTMVWSRAGVSDVSVDIGITPKLGWDVPATTYFNVDVDAIATWATDATVSASGNATTDRTNLITAINAAYADTGTSAAPKFHRITYSGAHIDEASTPDLLSSALNAGAANTYVVVVGNHSSGDRTRAYRLSGGTNTIFSRFEVHGLGASGSYAPNTVTNVVTLTGGNNGFHDCRFGYFWRGYISDANGDVEVMYRTQSNTANVALEKCEVAGWYRLFDGQGGRFFVIDLYAHHMREDPFFLTCRAQGDVWLYMGGFTAHRYVQQEENLGEPDHVDGLQTGVSTDSASYGYRAFQVFDYINLSNTGHYGGTGMRFQQEGSSVHTDLTIRNFITAMSGFDALVSAFTNVTVDGFIAIPGQSVGCADLRIDLGNGYGTGTLAISDVIFGGYRDDLSRQTPAISGVSVTLDQTLSSGATSIPTIFPNLSGEVRTPTYVGNNGSKTSFVPAFFDEECNPASVRAKLSASLMRGASWADSLNPITDPAGFGVHDWGFSASSAPVLSSLSIDGSGQTASVTTDSAGLLWWFVSTVDDADVDQTHVMYRMLSDGRAPAKWNGNSLTSPNPSWGRSFVSAGSVNIPIAWASLSTGVNYYLYLAQENASGRFSAVTKSTAFQKA